MDPDCRRPQECAGNKIHLQANGSMTVTLRHHKNVSKWGGRPISYPLPQDLVEMVHLHAKQGLGSLRLTSTEPDVLSYMFVDRGGKPFHDSTFSAYFQNMLAKAGGPRVTPQHCRHIFVMERMSPNRAPGPGNLEAAAVMGHSVRQWDIAYNPTLMLQRCEQAVMCMDTWRANMLASAAIPHAPGPPLPAPSSVQVNAQQLPAVPSVTSAGTARPTVLTAEDIPAPDPPLGPQDAALSTAAIDLPAPQQPQAPTQGQQPEVPHRPLPSPWAGASPLLSMMPGFCSQTPPMHQAAPACDDYASPLLGMLPSDAQEDRDEDDEIFIDIVNADEL